MDRSESTIAKVWIWHGCGGDFGVPAMSQACSASVETPLFM
jgi:hypothetical protein